MKLLGFIAIILVQGSLLPQLVKLYEMYVDKINPKQISELFYWMLTSGLGCFLIYSISIYDPVYITSNSIGLLQTSLSLYLIRKMKGRLV